MKFFKNTLTLKIKGHFTLDARLGVRMISLAIFCALGCSQHNPRELSRTQSVFALKHKSDFAWLLSAKKRWSWRISVIGCEAENLDQNSQTCLRGEVKVIDNVAEKDFRDYIMKSLEAMPVHENPITEDTVLMNNFITRKVYSNKESILKEFNDLSSRYNKLSKNLDKILGAHFLTEHSSHPTVGEFIDLGKHLREIESQKNAITASWTAVESALNIFINEIKNPEISEHIYLKDDGTDSFSAIFSSFFCVKNPLILQGTL